MGGRVIGLSLAQHLVVVGLDDASNVWHAAVSDLYSVPVEDFCSVPVEDFCSVPVDW